MLVEPSAAKPYILDEPVTGKALPHWYTPDELCFTIKPVSMSAALVTLLVPAPESRSAVPLKCPAVYTFPEESNAIASPAGLVVPVPPQETAHWVSAKAFIFNVKLSTVSPGNWMVPALGSQSPVEPFCHPVA